MLPPNYLSFALLHESIADGTAVDPQAAAQPLVHVDTDSGTDLAGNATVGGDRVGRDQIRHGDEVHGDKIAGDKVQGDKIAGDKITNIYITAPERSAQPASPLPAAEIVRKPFEPETVLIPAGPFAMGSPAGVGIPVQETPQHAVDLPTAYRLGKYPVSNHEYAHFLKQKPSYPEPGGGGWFLRKPPKAQENQPVVGVSWHDAQAYCAWLRAATGRTYRLPSEAEWEKAAHLAATNPAGCQAMVGKVEEWTSTIWGDDLNHCDFPYPYCATDGREEQSDATNHTNRVYRGGSALGAAAATGELRVTMRGAASADNAVLRRGFRLAMDG